MSKRHQSSRRKSYGRRQHEIHERSVRRPETELLDVRVEPFGASGAEAFDHFEAETRGARFRFAIAD